MILASKRPSKRPSVAVRAAMLFLRLYQLTISPALHALFGPGAGCRFQPTCSCYAGEAFSKHGFFAGFWLAIKRILRCHPFNSGGYDPVPDLKSEKSKDIAPSFKQI